MSLENLIGTIRIVKNSSARLKTLPIPICPPKILCKLALDWTWASTLKVWYITACAMTPPQYISEYPSRYLLALLTVFVLHHSFQKTQEKSCCRPQSPISKYHFNYYSLSSAPLSKPSTPSPPKQSPVSTMMPSRVVTLLCGHIWISRKLGKLGGCDVTVWWKCGHLVVVRNLPLTACSRANTLVMRIASADCFSACVSYSTVSVDPFIPVSGPCHRIWKELTVL